jgi:aldehyde dehydrogenase (NAD+)
MIDIADFAVGLSRQLYGNAMHSERRCIACTSSGIRSAWSGIITAFNFPARCGPGTR